VPDACSQLPDARIWQVATIEVEPWLREQCREYHYDLRGVFRVSGTTSWPLTATDPADLETQLATQGHLLPLPKEPAALANVLEVSIVNFLLERVDATQGQLVARRGSERFYPDLELTGPGVDGAFYAVDIKVARRGMTRSGPSNRTQSRITLYTGNTYFKHPKIMWDTTFRPFADYAQHLDVLGIYTLNPDSAARVEDLELIVQEPWRIGSKQRSSTTREYIGAVQNIDDLRSGRGEFETPEEFYKFWRAYKFRVGAAVAKRLERIVNEQASRAVTPAEGD
jgi:Restriction endonuclease EcoRV